MPTKKSKALGKAKSAKKAKPDKPDSARLLAEIHRQNPPYVVVDTGAQWLSDKAKEELVYRDQVERLFSGEDSQTPGNTDKPMSLDRAAEAVLFRQMLEPKSETEKEYLDRLRYLGTDFYRLADTRPGEATELILYGLLRLPEESLRQLQEGIRRCLKILKRERAERGRGRPEAQEKPAVLAKHVAVAFLRHVKKLTWPQIAEYFGMPLHPHEDVGHKFNTGILARQRDTYAGLLFESLLDCGVGADGEGLGRVLSEMDFHTEYMLGDVCGLPVREHRETCTKLAKELFSLAVEKGFSKPSKKQSAREPSPFDRLSRFYEMSLPHSTPAED